MTSAAKKPNGLRLTGADCYSPPELTGPTFGLLGRPSLDPASSEVANAHLIRAERYYARQGLERGWLGRLVWCHPPWHRATAWQWWCRGAGEWQAGRVRYLALVVLDTSALLGMLRRALDLGVPTPQQAARIEFADPVRYLRESRTQPMFPGEGLFERGNPARYPSALLLLTDEPDVVEAWRAAYAAGEAPCEALAPSRMPARRAALWTPMEQTSWIP